jgi:hypothetical protein
VAGKKVSAGHQRSVELENRKPAIRMDSQTTNAPPASLCTYTSRVQAVDVDTRKAVAVTVSSLSDNELTALKSSRIGDGLLQVEFRHNINKTWFADSNPPPVTCWAKAPHYNLEMISLVGTNDLVMAYMEAEEPTVLKWRNEQFSKPWEVVRKSDTNELHRMLLTDEYLATFRETYWYEEPWMIESQYIHWKQFVATTAADKQPITFGLILVAYYFGSLETAGKLTGEEQIKMASLKQIEQSKLYLQTMEKRYEVERIMYPDSQTAIVEAAFNAPLAGRGYRLEFKRFTITGVTVWLPVRKEQTWIS